MKYLGLILLVLFFGLLACWATFWTPHSGGAAYVLACFLIITSAACFLGAACNGEL